MRARRAPRDEIVAELLVEMDEHLGIAPARTAWPPRDQPGRSSSLVVELTVQTTATIEPSSFAIGCAPRREVDDRQPSRCQSDTPVDESSLAVRPAMDERLVHRVEDAAIDAGSVEREHPADPAHVAKSSARLLRGAQRAVVVRDDRLCRQSRRIDRHLVEPPVEEVVVGVRAADVERQGVRGHLQRRRDVLLEDSVQVDLEPASRCWSRRCGASSCR